MTKKEFNNLKYGTKVELIATNNPICKPLGVYTISTPTPSGIKIKTVGLVNNSDSKTRFFITEGEARKVKFYERKNKSIF